MDYLNATSVCVICVIVGGLIIFKKLLSRPMSKPLVIPKDKTEFTLSEIAPFNGQGNEGDSILTAIDGLVYDLKKGRDFYGNGGPYNSFAGRDSTRLLAKNQISDKTDTGLALNDTELEQLEKWKEFFNNKYGSIGKLVA